MKHLYRVAAFTVFFSFIFGFIWASFLKDSLKDLGLYQVKLGVPSEITSSSLKKTFSKYPDLQVKLKTYSNYQELTELLENAEVDLLLAPGSVVKTLISSKHLKKIDKSWNPFLEDTHVDFKNLEYDQFNEYTLPAFWDVYGLISKDTFNLDNPQRIRFLKSFANLSILSRSLKMTPLDIGGLGYNIQSIDEILASESVEAAQSSYVYFNKVIATTSSSLKFIFSEKVSRLIVYNFVVPEKAETNEDTTDFLELFFSHDFQKHILDTVYVSAVKLGIEDIETFQKPNYLRFLPLRQLEMVQLNGEQLTIFDKKIKDSSRRGN